MPAGFQKLREPLAFMRQKSGRLFIGFCVKDIFFCVCDIDIATEEERSGCESGVDPCMKEFHPDFFDVLSFRAGRAGGEIDAGQVEATRACLDESSFGIRMVRGDVGAENLDG